MANAYLIIKDNHALLIDPGGSGAKVVSYLEDNNIELKAILLTHGHFDHIAGVDKFVKKFGCPVYIDEEDEKLVKSQALNCSTMTQKPFVLKTPFIHYQIGENNIDEFTFEVIDAPGHTSGSVLLGFEEHLFTGDVVFKQGIGRCDLPSGSNSQMHQSIQKIKQLNASYIVYPGHGDTTTLQDELNYNPYF